MGSDIFKVKISKLLKKILSEWLKKTEYYAGFGSAKVAEDLVLVGKGWWLERHEYDGAESWHYKEAPKQVNELREVKRLAGGMWSTLSEINDPDMEDFLP